MSNFGIVLIGVLVMLVTYLSIELYKFNRYHKRIVKMYNKHIHTIEDALNAEIAKVSSLLRHSVSVNFSKDNTLALALYKVIVQRQKLSVEDVNATLNTSNGNHSTNVIKTVDRIHIKNVLLQLNWMESGAIVDNTMVDRNMFPKEPEAN